MSGVRSTVVLAIIVQPELLIEVVTYRDERDARNQYDGNGNKTDCARTIEQSKKTQE